jgi:hypothetical protein
MLPSINPRVIYISWLLIYGTSIYFCEYVLKGEDGIANYIGASILIHVIKE